METWNIAFSYWEEERFYFFLTKSFYNQGLSLQSWATSNWISFSYYSHTNLAASSFSKLSLLNKIRTSKGKGKQVEKAQRTEKYIKNVHPYHWKLRWTLLVGRVWWNQKQSAPKIWRELRYKKLYSCMCHDSY